MTEDERVKIALEFIETHAALDAVVRRAIGEVAHDAMHRRVPGLGASIGFPEMDAMHERLVELRKSWDIANGRTG